MAIWQCDFYMVPRQRLMQADETTVTAVSAEEWDIAGWWEGARLPVDVEALFDQFLPRSLSWNPDTTLWGVEDGTRVELQRDDDVVRDVFIRLDARAIRETLSHH